MNKTMLQILGDLLPQRIAPGCIHKGLPSLNVHRSERQRLNAIFKLQEHGLVDVTEITDGALMGLYKVTLIS